MISNEKSNHLGIRKDEADTLLALGWHKWAVEIMAPVPGRQFHVRFDPAKYGKAPSEYKGGQVCNLLGWNDDKPMQRGRIYAAADAGDRNIGVRATQIRGIDIDVDDPVQAQALEDAITKLLGPLPARGRRNSGRRLLVVDAAGDLSKSIFKLQSGDKVELLAGGQQFVAFGTHPSGERYEWRGLSGKVPVVPLDRLQAAWATVQAQFAAAADGSGTDTPSKAMDVLDRVARNQKISEATADTLLDLDSALAAFPDSLLDDYDGWTNKVGLPLASLKGTEHEAAALDLWHKHSSRSTAYDSDQVQAKWDNDLDATRATYKSIFHTAAVHGWMNPRKGQPPAVDQTPNVIDRIDFSTVFSDPPPDRRWLVRDWLPRGAVTSLYGPGGVGKSMLAEQLAIAVASGTDWLGLETTGGAVVGLFCEDDEDELRRRASWVFGAQMLEPSEVAPLLHLDARAGRDNALVSFDQFHLPREQPLLQTLRERCEQVRPALVILDNAAQLFAGQENDRPSVTAFCNKLTGIARDYDCAVLLLGHPAKALGSEFSGSTAWEAAVRARLFMELADDGSTTLSIGKANYSQRSQLRLEWRSPGGFVAVRTGEQSACLDLAKQVLRDSLAHFTDAKRTCSHDPQARNYLPKLVVTEIGSGAPAGVSEIMLRAALADLIKSGDFLPAADLGWKKPDRKRAQGLVDIGWMI